MMKLSVLALLTGLGMLVWLIVGKLSSDAIGMALGVVFGLMTVAPALMMIAAKRRREPEERIVYRDRIIYQVAEMEPELPQRPTAQLTDDWSWLADSLDSQAQVQLGVSPRQLPERRKVTP